MDNVVVGPWGKELETPQLKKEFETELVDDLSIQLAEELFDSLRYMGFDNLGEEQYAKDLAMIHQSIRSYMMKLQDCYHPVQDFADAFFDIDEEGGLVFDEYEIEFAPDE
jgi:hypothetical protein